MSFSRNLLKGLGLNEEQQTAVIEAHQSEMATVKEERERYKSEAEIKGANLEALQKQLDELKKANTNADEWKAKYEAEHAAHEKFKADTEAAAAKAAKESALSTILKDNFTDAGVAKILKYADLSGVELDEKGAVKGVPSLVKTLREEWPEFVQTTTTKGADIPNPPVNAAPSASFKSLSDAMKYANEHPGTEIDFSAILPPAPTVTT